MDWTTVQSNWTAFQDPILQRWPGLEQNDLIRIDGDRGLFERLVADATGQQRDSAAAEVNDWLMGEVPADVQMDETRDNRNIREAGRHIPAGEDVYSDDSAFGDEGAGEDETEAGDRDPPEPPIGRT